MKRNIKMVMILVILSVFGLSSMALACWDYGYGYMAGPGFHGGTNDMGHFPATQTEQLTQQRLAFFQATRKTRQKLYEKQLALQSELDKPSPDSARVTKLQKEVSQLQNNLEQKRLDFAAKLPRDLRDFFRLGHMNHEWTMGYGPHYGGYCWY